MLTGLTQKLWIIKVLFITYMTDNPLKVLTVYTLLEELKNSVWCQSTHLILLPNGIFSMYSSSIQVSLLDSLERCEKKIKIHIQSHKGNNNFSQCYFSVFQQNDMLQDLHYCYHLSHVKVWNLYLHQISFQHACDWQSWSARITNDFTQKGKLSMILVKIVC